MSCTSNPPSPDDLELLSHVLKEVARSRRLSSEDAQDFIQTAQMKLLERHYDIFRRFSGRSSLRTYLTVVVTRLLLDWRNSEYGKWRASAAAVTLGESAVQLERLVVRDGYTMDEAIAVVLGGRNAPARAELLRIVERLPRRPYRRRVSDEWLAEVGAGFEDPVGLAERRLADRRIRTALVRALRRLPAEDRWLIRVRFGENRSVQALASTLRTDPKKLYRRFDRTLRRLREQLVTAGVTGPDEIAI